MADDGVIRPDYAETHANVNAFSHSTRQAVVGSIQFMTPLQKNLIHFAALRGLNQKEMGDIASISQTTYGRTVAAKRGDAIKDPGCFAVQAWASYFNVTIDDLMNRDIAVEGLSAESHLATFDRSTMASALVTVKEALREYDVGIDELHLLAPVIVYSYEMRSALPREMSKPAYRAYDESVRLKLKGVLDEIENGNGVVAERGAGSGSKAKATRQKARNRR